VGDAVRTVPVQGGLRPLRAVLAEDAFVVVRRGAAVVPRVEIRRTTAPIEAGEVIGAVVYMSEGVEAARVPLIAAEAVPVPSRFARLRQWLRALIGGS